MSSLDIRAPAVNSPDPQDHHQCDAGAGGQNNKPATPLIPNPHVDLWEDRSQRGTGENASTAPPIESKEQTATDVWDETPLPTNKQNASELNAAGSNTPETEASATHFNNQL